ncbi:hypothetical protein Y032_0009g619 [Ancylostoma ceylanicum]|uniref:Reverse transcriptase domain-containing protein n=1 Tax=Ancylostoma ceylanicum TaxID=53326 RepID=A0A016VI18_9BILA|nr:hypothetical protein Y032_0009g619 [Ancylostoma ceylanicum]
MTHLWSNDLIPSSQHGFVPGRSVETNLLECLNDWSDILDRRSCCDIIYFDFAKAFDRSESTHLYPVYWKPVVECPKVGFCLLFYSFYLHPKSQNFCKEMESVACNTQMM